MTVDQLIELMEDDRYANLSCAEFAKVYKEWIQEKQDETDKSNR